MIQMKVPRSTCTATGFGSSTKQPSCVFLIRDRRLDFTHLKNLSCDNTTFVRLLEPQHMGGIHMILPQCPIGLGFVKKKP